MTSSSTMLVVGRTTKEDLASSRLPWRAWLSTPHDMTMSDIAGVNLGIHLLPNIVIVGCDQDNRCIEDNGWLFPCCEIAGAQQVFEEIPLWGGSSFSPWNSVNGVACLVFDKVLAWSRSGFSPGGAVTKTVKITQLVEGEDATMISLFITIPRDRGVFCAVKSEKLIDRVICTMRRSLMMVPHYKKLNMINEVAQSLTKKLYKITSATRQWDLGILKFILLGVTSAIENMPSLICFVWKLLVQLLVMCSWADYFNTGHAIDRCAIHFMSWNITTILLSPGSNGRVSSTIHIYIQVTITLYLGVHMDVADSALSVIAMEMRQLIEEGELHFAQAVSPWRKSAINVTNLGRLKAMEGPILCHPVMQAKLPAALISNSLTKSGQPGTAFSGAVYKYKNITTLLSPVSQPPAKNFGPICCSFSSSSDGNGYMAGNFNENDEDYVNSSVLEAVEVRSGSEGYVIKMRDGKNLRCVHNNSQGRNIPESAPQPAIVLRIEDGSETLLPIIVLEMPSVLLMAAIRNVHIARPTIYQVVKEMIDKMGYEVKLVRINKRIQEAYCAELYLTKIGDHTESITFDLRPSDAINIAVRCKVPIQVHRSLAYSDGIRSVEPARMAVAAGVSNGLLFTELDRPDGQPCVEAQEFELVRNMLIAAVEERYKDAATWRDKLMQLRSKRKNWA